MKILLVEPAPTPHDFTTGFAAMPEPLGLETIAAGLGAHHDVRLLDLRVGGELSATLEDFEPDVVATGAVVTAVPEAKRILREAKEHNPRTLTVVGGHHVTLSPGDLAVPTIDVAVFGEGEETFPELIAVHEEGGELLSVPGLAVRGESGWRESGPREQPDLDRLPFPDRELVAPYRDRYFRGPWRPVALISTARGCPFACHFCTMWKFYRSKCRLRTAESVVDELATLSQPYIGMVDDNTFASVPRAWEIVRRLKDAGLDKTIQTYARADTVVKHPDLIEAWREVGMQLCLVGLESFREEDLKDWRKRTTSEQNCEAIRILHRVGVEAVAYIVVNPDFTADDFDRVKQTVSDLELTHPIFTMLTPFPGSTLYCDRKADLTCHDLEKYDLFHAILPTRLPEREFYERFIDLYQFSYLSPRNHGRVGASEQFSFWTSIMTEMLLNGDPNPRATALARLAAMRGAGNSQTPSQEGP